MTEPTPSDWLHLKPHGYAPGNYMSRCHRCKHVADNVDKYATTCRPCAEAMHAAAGKPDATQQAVLRACEEALSAVPDDKPISGEWDRGFRDGLKCAVTVVRAALHRP